MTAREALDAYACENTRGGLFTREDHAPKAIKALRDVLHLHKPSTTRARVNDERYGPGRCAWCRHGEPINVYPKQYYQHEHTDLSPACVTCHGDDYESYADWPCATVTAIEEALR